MTYKEQRKLVENLRMLADFYERPENIVLPTRSLNQYESIGYYEWDQEKGEYSNNHEKSKKKLAAIARVLAPCEKRWEGSYLTIRKVLNEKIRLEFSISREAVCRRVRTDEVKVVPAVEAKPERIEPVYDWVCEDKSLLA
jgi:hypothetical protein